VFWWAGAGFDLVVYGAGKSAEGHHPCGARHEERHVAEEKYRMLFEQAQEGVFVATWKANCSTATMRL